MHLEGSHSVDIWQLGYVQGVASAASSSTSKEGAALSRAAGWDVGRPLSKGMQRLQTSCGNM